MKNAVIVHTESPMNPLSIQRQRPEAGLAGEKHHFEFGGAHASPSVQIFDYPGSKLPGASVRERAGGREIVDELGIAGLPQPPLHFTLLYDARLTPGEPPPHGLIRALVEEHAGELYLAFSTFHVPDPAIVEQITGKPWTGGGSPALVPLVDAAARARALSALCFHGWTDVYLLASPSPRARKRISAQWLDSNVLFQMTRSARFVPFDAFHALVRECDWVLTTHGRLPGRVPICLYSARDLRGELTALHARRGADSDEELLEITDLRELPGHDEAAASALPVSSVVGESAARSAATLSIADTDVTRLDELRDNPNLHALDVDGIPWLDTAVIAALEGLESLSMNQVKVDDLDFLVPVKSLRHLSLDRAPFQGLGGLAKVTQLRSLLLAVPKITDLEFLRSLTSLGVLSVEAGYSPAPSLDPLSSLSSLRELTLYVRRIADITPLAALRLEVLSLHATSVADLGALRAMDSLRGLDVGGTKIAELAPLRGLLSLRELNVMSTRVTDISPLVGLEGLRSLVLEYLDLEDFGALSSLSGLTDLSLGFCASFVDPTPLQSLAHLRHLSLRGTRCPDLAFTRRTPDLESLDVGETLITDFTPLLDLPRLRSLKVSAGRLAPELRAALARRAGFDLEETVD